MPQKILPKGCDPVEEIKEEIMRALSQKRETRCRGTGSLRVITVGLEGKNLSSGDAGELVEWLESNGYMASCSDKPRMAISISYME
jgi:hypothetical protein